MNLVAKEGVLVNQRDGVLILSEYAGASFELGEEAITVSPFDTYGTAEAIHEALTMPEEERRRRSTILREIVEKANISQWFYTQLEDALTSLNSQAKKDSTSSTPDTNKSEDSLTD
jgi:trehalose 6-phosphate synthase